MWWEVVSESSYTPITDAVEVEVAAGRRVGSPPLDVMARGISADRNSKATLRLAMPRPQKLPSWTRDDDPTEFFPPTGGSSIPYSAARLHLWGMGVVEF